MPKSALLFGAEPRFSELAENAVAALDLSDDEKTPALMAGLTRVAEDFWGDRLLQRVSGQPGKQRILLKQLAATLRKADALMLQLAPEYEAVISADGDERPMSLAALRAELRHRVNRMEYFDQTYVPQHGPSDFAIDEAVRKLIAIFESVGLEQPTVRQGRQGVEPSLLSKEARATGIVLQGVDPDLSTRTLVNKISEIAKGQEPVASHLSAIMSACDADLDACLLPSRIKTSK